MKKFIFDLITSPFSLFENPFYDYIAMAFIGYIAYIIAFKIVRELGFRGETGSIAHWSIRFVVMSLIWLACCIIIKVITFVIDNWLVVIISLIVISVFYIIKKYANSHSESIFNKRLF